MTKPMSTVTLEDYKQAYADGVAAAGEVRHYQSDVDLPLLAWLVTQQIDDGAFAEVFAGHRLMQWQAIYTAANARMGWLVENMNTTDVNAIDQWDAYIPRATVADLWLACGLIACVVDAKRHEADGLNASDERETMEP